MAKFEVGQKILVPAAMLGWEEAPTAVVERIVLDQNKRKVKVDGSPGAEPTWVASRRATHDIHILVVRLGDLATEEHLLDPLADSLHQHLRLLLSDSRVHSWRLRTTAEFKFRWNNEHALFTHVVLVCHGRDDAIKVVEDPEWVTGTAFRELLGNVAGADKPKEILSVGCLTGRAAFAKALSTSDRVLRVIAPYQSVHGSVALTFCHQYFASLLFEGLAPKNARKKAARALPGGSHFVTWTNGSKGT